jgi:hypothetical protein
MFIAVRCLKELCGESSCALGYVFSVHRMYHGTKEMDAYACICVCATYDGQLGSFLRVVPVSSLFPREDCVLFGCFATSQIRSEKNRDRSPESRWSSAFLAGIHVIIVDHLHLKTGHPGPSVHRSQRLICPSNHPHTFLMAIPSHGWLLIVCLLYQTALIFHVRA